MSFIVMIIKSESNFIESFKTFLQEEKLHFRCDRILMAITFARDVRIWEPTWSKKSFMVVTTM